MSRFNDLTGQKFNMLTAIKFLEMRNKNAYWECLCDCGKIHVMAGADLKRGQTKSCGCARRELQSAKKFKDITGQIFGRLTVIKFLYMHGKNRVSYYECKCECGTIKEIARSALVKGGTVSCGCYNRDKQLLAPGVSTFNNYLNGYKQSARKRGYSFELTNEQFQEIISKNCVICDIAPKEISRKYKETASNPIFVNGVDRKDNKLGYIYKNVQPMCTPCNKAKSALGEKEFLAWIRQLVLTYRNREVME